MKRLGSILAAVVVATLAATSLDCGGGAGLGAGGLSGSGGSAGGAGGGGNARAGAGGSTNPTPDTSALLPNGKCIPNAFPRDGVCVCAIGTPNACPSSCVDLANDPDQCGACTHTCVPGATCVAGACGPAPVTIVPPTSGVCGPIDLAVADGTLYWAERTSGDVTSLSFATNTTTVLASGEKAPANVLVRGDTVFWRWMTKTIRSKKAGAGPIDAFDSPTELGGYTVSEDGVRLYASLTTGIDELFLGAGNLPHPVAAFDNGSRQFGTLALSGSTLAAVDATDGFIEWITLDPNKVAACEARDPSGNDASVGCARVGQGLPSLLDVLVFASGHVVWADGFNVEYSGSTTAPTKVFAAMASDDITGLAAAADWTYFATKSPGDGNGLGVIYKAPLQPNQTPVAIARSQLAPRSLATDGQRVYWSTGDCAIRATDL